MQVQKVIEQLGYTAKEAKVYLAALALGEAHISDIAAKVKIPRSSAQAIVEKLRKDGAMNFYVQRRYKYWVAESPEHLLANYKKREEAMRNALPELAAIRHRRGIKRDAEISERSLGVFRAVADASSQPVLVANERVEIIYANIAWQEQFGYTLEEVIGQNPRMLQSGKTPREVYQRMWTVLKAEKMFQSDEIIDKRKDGTFFNLLTTIFPLRRAEGMFYIQILDDITAKKRAEKLGSRFIHAAT
jgi:PAS domain S-box-containing protein